MSEADERAVPVRHQVDFDATGAGRYRVLAGLLTFPPPREDDAARRLHFEILPARNRLLVDLHPVDAAGLWIEFGLAALPLPHLVRVDEEIEHGFRPGRDPDLALDDCCDLRLLDGHVASFPPRVPRLPSTAPDCRPRKLRGTTSDRRSPPAAGCRAAGSRPDVH